MKKFLIFCLMLLVNSVLYSQIDIKISTDKQVYQVRDSIKIYVTATNTTGQSITLNWNTTCQAGYEIINEYKLFQDTSCYEMLTSLTLDSAQWHTWSFSYHALPSGHHQIFGEVYGYGFSDTTEIVVDEDTFSYYSASVKNINNQLISGVTVTSYAPQAITDANGKFTLKYSSLEFPDGFSIVPVPIEFYHPDYGDYHDTISISEGDSIIGPDVILSKLVSVTGNIKFDNGDPAQNCYVYFFNSKNYYVASASDASGNYILHCIPGFYFVGASLSYNHGDAWTFRMKYYNDKTYLADAELVEVNSQTSGIDFTFPYLQLGTISGRIIDGETQQPISNAWITIESVVPSDSTFSDTDGNGNYTIEAFEGTYNVSAYVPGYYKQFYKEVYNTFDAIPITLDKDSLNIKGIDFSLIKPEPGSNTIFGTVMDKNNSINPLYGVEVYAIPVDGGNWIESTSGSDGTYFLKDLKNGNYILFFYKENCISQFLKNYSATCDEWEDAFVFELNGGDHISYLYTFLEPMDSIGGQITGSIYNSLNSSISGTLISAVDSAGNTISSSVSVFNGSYLIPYLKNGSYTVKASKIGYQTSKYSDKINIDLSNKPVINGVNIYFALTDAKENKKIIPTFYNLSQNYPNPFNPSTTIEYEIPKESFVTIKVYNIIGKEVSTVVNEQKNAGYYQVKFNASNLPTGIYFCRINAGDYFAVIKMLLLK